MAVCLCDCGCLRRLSAANHRAERTKTPWCDEDVVIPRRASSVAGHDGGSEDKHLQRYAVLMTRLRCGVAK